MLYIVGKIFFSWVRFAIVYSDLSSENMKCLGKPFSHKIQNKISKCLKQKRETAVCHPIHIYLSSIRLLVRTLYNWYLYLLYAFKTSHLYRDRKDAYPTLQSTTLFWNYRLKNERVKQSACNRLHDASLANTPHWNWISDKQFNIPQFTTTLPVPLLTK